jgi:hypothetical protein
LNKGVVVAEHEMLLSFDTDDKDFCRGFEAGRLWALARSDLDEFTETVGSSNIEMVLRIGEATDRHVVSEDLDDEWIAVTFGAPGTGDL